MKFLLLWNKLSLPWLSRTTTRTCKLSRWVTQAAFSCTAEKIDSTNHFVHLHMQLSSNATARKADSTAKFRSFTTVRFRWHHSSSRFPFSPRNWTAPSVISEAAKNMQVRMQKAQIIPSHNCSPRAPDVDQKRKVHYLCLQRSACPFSQHCNTHPQWKTGLPAPDISSTSH